MNPGHQSALRAYQSSRAPLTGVAAAIELYDQAIGRLTEARRQWSGTDFDDAFESLRRTAMIFETLAANLDHQRGKQVSATLLRYYNGLSFQILAVPRQTDPLARIDSVIRQIAVVRDAWAEVLAQTSGAQSGTIGTAHGANGIDVA